MARPHPSNNVSFGDDVPPSRRAGRLQDDAPPRPPAKSGLSKTSFQTNSSAPLASPVNYDSGFVDVGSSNPQGYSSNNGADVRRKKSMVKPERERVDPGHRLWHYREHAAEDNLDVQASTTGAHPVHLRRGKSLLGRDSDQNEGGFLRRGTLRRRKSQANKPPQATQVNKVDTGSHEADCCPCLGDFVPGPKTAWMVYCYFLTICIPNWALKSCGGKRTPEAQRAWREKVGIVSVVLSLMACVGFLTFGFTQTVCGTQPLRIKGGEVRSDSVVIHGYDYDMGNFKHPRVDGFFNGSQNPLYMDEWMAGGTDLSFLFQNVNQKCLNIITPAPNSGIRHEGNIMAWYFPCNIHSQYGTSASSPVNLTGIESGTNCHTASDAGQASWREYANKPTAEVYFTWGQVRNESRNLAVYKSAVIDMSLLQWLDPSQVSVPPFFDTMRNRNETFAGNDITALVERAGYTEMLECLVDVIQVGFVDSISIGCVASDIVLYLSLVFILGAVSIKFFMALYFGWFMSWKLGNFKNVSYAERMKRAAEVEQWSDDIYRAAPANMRPNAKGNRKTVFLPTTSRFSKAEPMLVNSRPATAYSMADAKRSNQPSMYGNRLTPAGFHNSPPDSPMLRNSRSSTSLPFRDESGYSLSDQTHQTNANPYGCPFPLANVVPQPAPDFRPFEYDLVHSICLVTAYSESYAGLRTTLDSLATTDYPNSHKMLLVICDGIVRGSDSKTNESTHEVVLSMMKELIVHPDDAERYSCLAIADGGKRENKAIVYAGFYNYDNDTVEERKQQRVPMVLVAKVGNDDEQRQYQQAGRGKPGNRGKRDSQIILMAFLQKVIFDERMTQFEYEFFNAIWRVCGVPPDKFETVLCVDADTKVFPDSLTRMNACLVHDPDIMGLCGETKIANKKESWVTMIQVFEYYISHHLSKAFESVFGGVTCLPGCFSIYRIKAPKGERGYWVPILANPDIVEHYSENVVDTLHKKNLLLLGEDRYLSTLMLKTFPKRKMMFCPQAVCKTQVPERFRILLSQRRRWINSTVHNLCELVLVRDLCGTFCFSMQFVVFMDLVGTLVLPAAISFTIYIIIVTILPQSVTKMERPILSLILLALILGLPGVLIVVTTRKMAYVGWMFLYLLSLPIWNLVLPAYSYWHMDDFTWGETRKIHGETKEVAHGDKEGKFDPANIVMKRWQEFERERRWKSGTQSRDSGLYDRGGSPRNAFASNRYSLASTNETYQSGGAFGAVDSNPFRQSQSFASMAPYTTDPASSSQLAAPTARRSPNSSAESGYSRPLDRMPSDDPSTYNSYPSHLYSPDAGMYDEDSAPILQAASSPEPAFIPPGQYANEPRRQPSHGRGVSLVDTGPVAHEPVRRVSKHQRRSSSRQYLSSPISSSNHASNLPPGAAPPQHQ